MHVQHTTAGGKKSEPITSGTIISIEVYAHTAFATRRYGKVVVAPNTEWLVVQWLDGGFREYIHRKSVRVEHELDGQIR
jgi:hypothetical protein